MTKHKSTSFALLHTTANKQHFATKPCIGNVDFMHFKKKSEKNFRSNSKLSKLIHQLQVQLKTATNFFEP